MTEIQVRHFGNTANNAYFNAMLLQRYADIGSELPIRMFGLRHGISAPAWEAIDFEVPDADWVHRPDWTAIPGATAINSEFSDLPVSGSTTADSPLPSRGLGGSAMSLARALIQPMHGKRWAQPLFELSYRWVLSRRSALQQSTDAIDVLYGGDSMINLRVPEGSQRTVCLEHGTVRWIADGDRETGAFRSEYRRQVQAARHLWVTNLDPRTLEIAEDVAPGRWSALPHPFVPDPRVPFIGSSEKRQELLDLTGSEALLLLPSSQNWSKHHDKGSMKALSAFIELRRQGVNVGLIAVEWGLQVAESKAFLEKAGVAGNVVWVLPMARFGLQRMMADVDIVWDQFGLDAFGALALRAVEQGTPLVSRGLTPSGEALIGGPVPWTTASSADDIVRETSRILEQMSRLGRDAVIQQTRSRYRGWLLDRHSPEVAAALQQEIYSRVLDGTLEPGSATPDRWARMLNESAGEET